MRVLLEDTTFLQRKIIIIAGINEGRVLFEEIRYVMPKEGAEAETITSYHF